MTRSYSLQREFKRTPAWVFFLPFVLSLGAYGTTMLDHIGPGPAAGWAAAVLGIGMPDDAVLAPLYRIVLHLRGWVGSLFNSPLLLASWAQAITMALATGFFALILAPLMRKMNIWGPNMVASMGGAFMGVAALPWTVALTLNPAPLALVFLLASLALLSAPPDPRYLLFAALLFGLSATAYLPVLLFVPAWIVAAGHRVRQTGISVPLLVLVFWLPTMLLFLPATPLVFKVNGLLSVPPNVPADLSGWTLAGWGAWTALTPVGLILAVVGVIMAVRVDWTKRADQPQKKRLVSRAYLVLVMMSLFAIALPAALDSTAAWAAVTASILVTLFAMITVAALSKLTFSGLALLLWVLLPVFWFTRGPEVNRHGEDFWQIHARNVFATQRANSIIATTDHQRLLAPWLVLQKNEDIRKDLLAVDPTRLHLTGYLETLNLEEIISDPELLGLMADLQAAIDQDDVPLARSIAAHFFLEWTRNAIEVPEIGGVLLSNELSLDDNFQLIPDGLLWRVWNGRTNHPFLFAGLDLGPVYVRDDATPLMIQTIQLYPDMFTRRATWLSRESWTVLASDYVKWSLRIDPTHVQARLLQEEFGVHGDPLYLRPKRPPRVRRGLEGVSE